jgi:hypothetical protein
MPPNWIKEVILAAEINERGRHSQLYILLNSIVSRELFFVKYLIRMKLTIYFKTDLQN